MGQIQLQGMEFFAYHGFYQEEQVIGNKYLCDLSFEYDFEQAALSDNIEGTLDYQLVYDIVDGQMQIKSKLLEHVGTRVVNSLKSSFPGIKNIEFKLSKLRPPIKGVVEKITVVCRA
jgi:dihydroneopterin aldolase